MQSSGRAVLRAWLVRAMGLFLAAAVIGGLTLHGDARSLSRQGLGLLAVWMAAAVCWLAVPRVGIRRWEVRLSAAAVTSFAAGLTCYAGLLSVAGGESLPFPSAADAIYLLFYPLMLAALGVAVRNQVRGLASSVWLDSAVGSLGAAAVLAVLLSPTLDSALEGSLSLGTVVAVAYPLFDLLLVAAAAGIVALGGARLGSRWGLLVAGLLVFAGADVAYALQVTEGSYVVGTTLDTGWGIGLALVAVWVDGIPQDNGSTVQDTRPSPHAVSGAAALAVSSVATVAGLAVLVAGTRAHLSTLAVALAGVTLLAAAARTQLSFRQLEWMSDLRQLAAATDDLTGLPNRRALYAEGNARLLEPQCQRQALLMLDLDKFKDVNDSLGHHAGDLLLVEVGVRLSNSLRAGDMLARLGGDEFAVLLRDAGHEEAVDVAIRIRATLAQRFDLEDIALHPSVSIGIALFPDHGPDLSALLRMADIAMYRAKTSGDGHHVYSSVEDAGDATRLQRAAPVSPRQHPGGTPAAPRRHPAVSASRVAPP